MTKLLVVDDHPVLREGLVALLRQSDPDATLLQAATAEDALALVAGAPDLDLVILDLALPGTDGRLLLQEFRRRRPELRVLMLSSSENPADALELLKLGALGYVPKSASPQTLLSAMRLVLNGESYVPRLILGGDNGAAPEPAIVRGVLTARQVEILRCLAAGETNGGIARRFGLSEKTVKAHVSAIFRGLNVVNRTQAVRAGQAAGLL
jgi:DNA-binding NarL/FixJ family response regulator